MPDPDSPHEPISLEELQKALCIWCTVAPKRMWRDFIHHSETKAKWSSGTDPFDRFNANHAFAEYLVGKFRQAGWSVSQPARGPIGDQARQRLKAPSDPGLSEDPSSGASE